MIGTLFNLTIQGTATLLFVLVCEALLGRRMQARGRRWWWVLVPLSFLALWRIEALPAHTPAIWPEVPARMEQVFKAATPATLEQWRWALDWVLIGWAGGVAVSALLLFINTWKVSRRWAGQRLSTDSSLLSLLEDCKAQIGVQAPVGIIVSPQIEAPAILGWLRPRLLLPVGMTDETVLRHVMLHELAHFRGADIPIGWLYAAARCVHWFNPMAHVAERAWSRYREEAADEAAMRCLSQPAQYGDTLIGLVGRTEAAPYGALGIGESFSDLKTRITKIMKYDKRTPQMFLALLILALVTGGLILRAEEADPKAAAVAAMETWLKGIDQGKYAESWKEASTLFQKAVTSDQWVAALNSVRGPLGECKSRKLISAMHQTEVPHNGKVLKGDFVIAQFDTSYANMKYTIETVSFEKEDGVWKASGYFVKPGN